MYTEDKNYGLVVFDSVVMDKIREIKKAFNTKLELMINKQTLYIRFFMSDFNTTLSFASSSEIKTLYKYYKIIDDIYELSELIDENIKKFEIGAKQEEGR